MLKENKVIIVSNSLNLPKSVYRSSTKLLYSSPQICCHSDEVLAKIYSGKQLSCFGKTAIFKHILACIVPVSSRLEQVVKAVFHVFGVLL